MKFFVRQQVELMHRESQFRKSGPRHFVGDARFEPLLRAAEAIAQRTAVIEVTEFPQKLANVVRFSSGLFHQTQRGGERYLARLGIFEHAALKRTALHGAIGVDLAGAISAQSRARLTEIGNWFPGARDRHRQSERLHFLRVIARPKLDIVEERTVTAQSAGEAKLFTRIHSPPSR